MPVITPGERDFLSDPSILKENSKKNFIRENIKHLKQLERKNRRDKKKSSVLENRDEMLTIGRRPLGKSRSQSKFVRKRVLVESKSSKSIVKSLPKSPTTQVELNSKTTSVSKPRNHRSKKKERTKVIQTIGAGDAETESDEEVVKKVSVANQSRKKENKSHQLQNKFVEDYPPTSQERISSHLFSPFNVEDIKREMKAAQDVDFIKLNQLVQYKPKKNARNAKTDPTKAPPTYQRGVLPKYLRETKKEPPEEVYEPIKEYRSKNVINRSISNHHNVGQNLNNHHNVGQNIINKKTCSSRELSSRDYPKEISSTSGSSPSWHILISDNERKQQLSEIRRQYAELINKLYKLPSNDKKSRQLRIELENNLENLEGAIALFSKDKLFVKIAT